MTIKTATAIIGGLSNTAKMPGFSYSLPAKECHVGSKLRGVKGSVCSTCYALKGNYSRYPAIFAAQYKRLDTIYNADWVDSFVYILTNKKMPPFFRWHDSGDLQSVEHLNNIIEIAKRTPHIMHWLPTKEKALIKNITFPKNLTVRLSAPMHNMEIKTSGVLTSSVVSDAKNKTCKATKADGCGTCRDCWDPTIKNISYLKH